jgi:hypothetical protein
VSLGQTRGLRWVPDAPWEAFRAQSDDHAQDCLPLSEPRNEWYPQRDSNPRCRLESAKPRARTAACTRTIPLRPRPRAAGHLRLVVITWDGRVSQMCPGRRPPSNALRGSSVGNGWQRLLLGATARLPTDDGCIWLYRGLPLGTRHSRLAKTSDAASGLGGFWVGPMSRYWTQPGVS